MIYNLQDKYNRFRFAQACDDIWRTPPAKLDPSSEVMLFTQLQHKDVLLALIAFKSFSARLPVGAIRVLNDGSLTAGDQDLLRGHLPGVQFLDLASVRSEACPRGGCWERLLWIARLTQGNYVVQLDSDTLTLDEIPEVGACLADGGSFVIGTWDDQEFETMEHRQAASARRIAGLKESPHVQLFAEANFDKIKQHNTMRYVRGCAGFSGFAKGSVDKAFIEDISSQMRSAIGEVWHKWGSEQVMSNIVVANDPKARVLPHPKYSDCSKLKEGQTVFVHFIGSCRFVGGVYKSMAQKVIGDLILSDPEARPTAAGITGA